MTIRITVYRTGCLEATHATGMANSATVLGVDVDVAKLAKLGF
jgi:hypothetical protein